MFYLFWTYVEANVLCYKCCMTRQGEWAQTEVVPSDMPTPTCMHKHIRTVVVGGPRPTGAVAGARNDNSSYTWTGAAAASRRTGRSCMHALWGPPKQSGRQRHGARIPSIGRMHLEKCVACAISCRMQRDHASGVWAGSRRGHPNSIQTSER
jgi:hypothetical protein